MDHVGARLRVARTDAQVTLTQMAARTNYSKSHLCNVELGKRPATPDLVLAYERVLGDSVNRRGALAIAATVVVSSAVAELVQHGFAAAIGPRRDVDEWVARAEGYGQDYMSLGAAELQGRLAADLVVLQQELDSPHLWGVAARLMTVHGKTLPGNDGGRGRSGRTRWPRSRRTAPATWRPGSGYAAGPPWRWRTRVRTCRWPPGSPSRPPDSPTGRPWAG
ncbi:hypothetical protein GCM10027615_13990 [Plantactinospora veratri]